MDRQSTEQLAVQWTQAQRLVGAFIATMLGDFDAVDEVLSRVAVAVVRKYEQYDPARPFAAWAIGIARIEVMQYRRLTATDRHIFDDALIDRITQRYQQQAARIDPHRQALSECLKRIDGRARQALELRYVSNFKPAAIARELSMNGGALRMLLTRTRQALRECIERRLARSEAE